MSFYLSRRATALERAEDAAGDEGESEEGEHDDGADAQLRDRVLGILLPPPRPTLLTIILPGLGRYQLFITFRLFYILTNMLELVSVERYLLPT